MTTPTVEERFFPKLVISAQKLDQNGYVTPCLEWTGARSDGYGHFRIGQKVIRSHRWLYERWVGPIAPDLVLDHLCRNRVCVNPEHLEPISNRLNILRGSGPTALKKQQTHCKYGHALEGENVYTRPSRPNARECRTCNTASMRRMW